MSNYHVMVDIETLAVENSAIVLSVGAVVFNFDTRTIEKRRHWKLNVNEQSNKGRTVKLETLQWWLGQGKEAQEEFFEERVDVKDFIKEFTLLCEGVSHGWAKGIQFDFGILRHLFKQYDYEFPIHYGKQLDVRVCYFLVEKSETSQSLGQIRGAHNPLNDSIYQCQVLFNYLNS